MHYPIKNPDLKETGVTFKCLAVTYSHMGKPHTTIGAKQFHFRVRDGIGWFPLAIATRQTLKPVTSHEYLVTYDLLLVTSQPKSSYLKNPESDKCRVLNVLHVRKTV